MAILVLKVVQVLISRYNQITLRPSHFRLSGSAMQLSHLLTVAVNPSPKHFVYIRNFLFQ